MLKPVIWSIFSMLDHISESKGEQGTLNIISLKKIKSQIYSLSFIRLKIYWHCHLPAFLSLVYWRYCVMYAPEAFFVRATISELHNYFPLYTAHCTAYCTAYTLYCALQTVHFTHYVTHCTMYTWLYIIHCN